MRPRRPPGPPPLRVELILQGAGSVEFEINAAAEPDVAARIAELADAGSYNGGEVRRKAYWLEIHVGPNATPRRVETRRVKQSVFDAGSIGWSWSGVPSAGDGSLFVTFGRQPGLDAPYQEIGRVVAGLDALEALPSTSTTIVRGRPTIGPGRVESARRIPVATV